jgi:hypothetical protein
MLQAFEDPSVCTVHFLDYNPYISICRRIYKLAGNSFEKRQVTAFRFSMQIRETH